MISSKIDNNLILANNYSPSTPLGLYKIMITEGLKLMVTGMVIVYIFLIVLMLLVILSSKIFKGTASGSTSKRLKKNLGNDEITVVISAAIAAYKARKSK